MVSCNISFHMEKNIILTHDAKEEYLNIRRLVYFYTMQMQKHHLIDEIVIDNTPAMVNPFYGRVEKGSAYVVEYARGVPAMIYSNLGAWEIPAAKLCRGYLNDYKALQNNVDRDLGQMEIQPMIRNRMDMIGPRYMITQMPWLKKDQTLPLEFKPQTILASDNVVGSEAESAYVKELCRYVDHYFRAVGHPEIIGAEVDATKAPVSKEAAPKKRTCVIMGQMKHLLKTHGTTKD